MAEVVDVEHHREPLVRAVGPTGASGDGRTWVGGKRLVGLVCFSDMHASRYKPLPLFRRPGSG